jgi:hypothetical protein
MAFAKNDRKEPALGGCVLAAMQYDHVIKHALRDAHDLLLANLAPARNLPDDRTVAYLRAIMARPEVGLALERGNDTALCFVLRAVKHILSDTRQSARAAINRLWGIMDEPELNRALGIKQNSHMMLWRKKPPAR